MKLPIVLMRSMSSYKRFSSLVGRSPKLLASSQAGMLMCIGDLISQSLVEKKSLRNIDLIRTARFGLVGFAVVGPTLRWWFGVLEKRVKLATPAATAIGKMAADQLLFAPVALCNFVSLMGALNGDSLAEIKNHLRTKYFDILMNNYKLWPAAQLINFWLVPVQHRILFAQSVAVFWNTYLSYTTNRYQNVSNIRT